MAKIDQTARAADKQHWQTNKQVETREQTCPRSRSMPRGTLSSRVRVCNGNFSSSFFPSCQTLKETAFWWYGPHPWAGMAERRSGRHTLVNITHSSFQQLVTVVMQADADGIARRDSRETIGPVRSSAVLSISPPRRRCVGRRLSPEDCLFCQPPSYFTSMLSRG